jgi:hypothetical protein
LIENKNTSVEEMKEKEWNANEKSKLNLWINITYFKLPNATSPDAVYVHYLLLIKLPC